ncbi:hypothetical protein QJS04_geneDACA013046 [Acorus gramineus]|uniref:Uncharacterized protein n=1 Tax=Acorus gramineus TaxID=55184 RepID=A0AAV9B3A1_ACOGR|nr:hypothetical protein QJS04_geneDACA013046 [Acorus gramineus]
MKTVGDRSPDPCESSASTYYPGCRKDANCGCDICLASFAATRDLLPPTAAPPPPETPPLLSTAKSRRNPPLAAEAEHQPETDLGRGGGGGGEGSPPAVVVVSPFRSLGLALVMVVVLVLAVDLGLPRAVSGVLKPRLSAEVVGLVGEEARGVGGGDLREKLGFLKGRLGIFGGGDSVWELKQEGQLFQLKCILLKSAAEEVSVWGWPLRAAGPLKSGSSARSLTVLSGKVYEWSVEQLQFVDRSSNGSWIHGRWRNSAVRMDADTWILEYRRSPVLENSRLFGVVGELLKVRVSGIARHARRLRSCFGLDGVWARNGCSRHHPT